MFTHRQRAEKHGKDKENIGSHTISFNLANNWRMRFTYSSERTFNPEIFPIIDAFGFRTGEAYREVLCI